MTRGSIAAGVVCVVVGAVSPWSSRVPPAGRFAFAASARAYTLPIRVSFPQVDTDLELALLNLINEERMSAGVPPLMPHATIQRAARAHGRELLARGTLSHLSSDGRTPRDRVLDLGVRVRLIGENLAYADTAFAAHQAMMASPEHRANLLLPQYRLTGIAVLGGTADGVLVVEDYSDEGADPLEGWWKVGAERRP